MHQRILVVDDDEASRKFLRVILQRSGYSVLEAADGNMGLARAQDELPDLILMDVQLPGISGLTATRLLKQGTDTRKIPVIAVTAFALSGDAERILQSGFDSYFAKPIDFAELLETIRVLLPSGSG